MTGQNEHNASSVFISYSRKDKEFVGRLNDSLDSNGVGAWVDWEGIPLSSDWMDEITRAIEGSDAFLFVISPDSLASKVCKEELELGLKYNKKLVPILHRDPEKGTELHTKLAATNWVYLRDIIDDYDATIPKLIESIQTDLDWVRQHTRLLQRATEWDRKNRNNSFLLQGADLEEAERWMIDASTKPNREVTPLQAEYIAASRQAATRRQRSVLIGVSLALVVSVLLAIFALFQRSVAIEQRGIAQENEAIAKENEARAVENEAMANEKEQARATQQAIAEANEARAVQNETIAKAQRSASEARIYQNQAGELDLSTLLAIDSWQRSPSFLAEDILRRNTSLIPMPVSQMAHKDKVSNIQLDPQGENFVTASADGTACVWDFEAGRERFCVKHESVIQDALFSRDGRFLITGDGKGSLRFWEAGTGKLYKKLDFKSIIWDLSASPDGHWLSVARDDNTVSLVDLTDLESEPRSIPRSSTIYTAVFSPDSAWLAIGEKNGDVIIWNIARKFFLKGPQHLDEVYVVAFSPDGKWIASGGADSTVRVAQALTGQEELVLHHGDWVEDIAFSPDGSWFAVASDDNRVWVWETTTGIEKLRLRHDNFVQEVKVSADGQWIAATGYDQSVRIWDAVSGSQMMLVPLNSRASALAFNPAGTRLVVGDHEGHISIWDISYLLARRNTIEFPEYVHEALFSPNGEWLVANTDQRLVWQFPFDQLLGIKSTAGGQPIISAEELTYDLEVSPDSAWVIAAEREKSRAILYNQETQISTLLNHDAKVTGVAFGPGNSQGVTAGENGKIIVWDLKSGEGEYELQNPTAAFSVAVQPDGKKVAAGLRNRTFIWDLEKQEKFAELSQAGVITSLVYSDDGQWLASASEDGTIYIWNAEAGYEGEPTILRLNGQPQGMDFSPDNRWLAAGGSSTFAYLWDLSSGEEVARLPHSDSVTSVSFSKDGKLLATVSRKVVQFWDVSSLPLINTANLINVACSHLTANISESQWELIFPGEEYRPICPDLQMNDQ
jgi:WD40 repeat protein